MTPFDQFLTALRTADEQAIVSAIKWITRLVDRKDMLPKSFFDGIDPTPLIAELQHVRNTLAQTIAIMEVARKAIEDAPHERNCMTIFVREYQSRGEDVKDHPCTCWKSRAIAEIDALAAKTT